MPDWPTLEPLLTLLLDTPQFFVMFWNSIGQSVAQVAGNLLYHEKIMIATVREYDYDEVKERIQKLIDVSYTYDQMKIVAAMKDIVPEFVSKNSCFEALDKKK